MSSLASFPRGNASAVEKEDSKEDKKCSFPRSSSPSRALDDEDIEWKKEGVTTRSAKRKAVAKEKSCMRQGIDDKSLQQGLDANEEQLLTNFSKKSRLLGVGKQYIKKSSHNRDASPEKWGLRNWENRKIVHTEDETYHVNRSNFKSRAKRTSYRYYQPPIFTLGGDELERVCNYLDTNSSVNLLRTCKEINRKLSNCSGFWHQLCKNENFHEYSALKQDGEMYKETSKSIINTSDTSPFERESKHLNTLTSQKTVTFKDTLIKSTKNKNSDVAKNIEAKERMSWSGEMFHDVIIPSNATHWRKVYLRGLQMRRNICNGRFELWRLFLTDENHLPVKKMTLNTSFRELRSEHRGSNFNRLERRVRIHRYWNEDYFIAIQQGRGETTSFHDVFVWRWEECQKPRFCYSYSFQKDYPTGLFPTAFFLWQSYLVLMPDTRHLPGSQTIRSIIRVHDLSSEKKMELVGSYDFPESSPMRRFVPGVEAIGSGTNETAHLHKLGDFAVALCRTPLHTILIFSLPHCELVHQVKLCELGSIERPFEDDDLDQRFLMRNNTMMFMFHHPAFFDFDEVYLGMGDHDNVTNRRFGRLVFIDFTSFLSSHTKNKKKGQPSKFKRMSPGDKNSTDTQNSLISMKIDPKFDSSSDYIEKISVISRDRMVCVMQRGNIVLRDIKKTTSNPLICSHNDRLSIPCPTGLKLPNDVDLDVDWFHDTSDGEDIDGPTLCTSRDGDVVMVMRHFKTGRYIHAYETLNEGRLLYEINIDADPRFKLTSIPGYVSVDMDGNFVCAADLDKIVVWNSRNGKFIRVIPIVPHYNSREDPLEAQDRYCWKGHTDFAFAEDGIIIVHSQRNFPVAADIVLFW